MNPHRSSFARRPAPTRIALAVQLACAGLFWLNPAAAQSSAGASGSPTLAPVTVQGRQESVDEAPPAAPGGQTATGTRLGILGNQPVMSTPFSVTGYTAETISNEQARSVADLISVDPSIRMASARSNINEDFTIRGFPVGSGDFALNGMFGLLPYWRAPLEAVERVEIVKGPSSALFGTTPAGSVGGVVNLVPKRAGNEPLTRLTAGVVSDSVFGAHADIGRRFGPDNAWGARINLMARAGDTPIDAQQQRDNLASLGLDFRQARFRASLDLLRTEQRFDNLVRQLSLSPTLTAVPRAPDGTTSYPGFGFTDGRDGSALFKAEADVTDAITAYVGYGQRKQHWGAIAANPTLTNAAGDYTYFGGWQRQSVDSKSMEAGLRGNFNTGGITHNATLGFTKLDQDQQLGFYTGFPGGASNLYSGQLFSTPSIAGISNPLRPYLSTKLTSVALADTMGFMQDRLLVTLGVRRQTVEAQNYNFATGAPSGPHYDQGATTPVAGIVFKLQPNLSLYASYVEGLTRGDTAPISAAVSNPGEMLPPYKSKQKEIGVKWNPGTFVTTLALFELTKPNAALSGTTFGINGEQRNRGVEGTVSGEVARGTRLLGGLTFLDGELSKSATASLVGKKAIGVPRWQANLGAEWDASFLPGLTLSGRVVYTDEAYVNATNTLSVPSWTRYDVGARYATKIASKPVTFRLNVENLFDRNYYNTATAGYLSVGTSRTFALSATIDF